MLFEALNSNSPQHWLSYLDAHFFVMLSHAFESEVHSAMGDQAALWLWSTSCTSLSDVAFMWHDGADLVSDCASTREQDFGGACQLVAFWHRCRRLASSSTAVTSSAIQQCRQSIIPSRRFFSFRKTACSRRSLALLPGARFWCLGDLRPRQ